MFVPSFVRCQCLSLFVCYDLFSFFINFIAFINVACVFLADFFIRLDIR